MQAITKAAINNNKSLLTKPESYFTKLNETGDTTLHILAKYNHLKLLKQILNKYPKLIDTVNDKNETVLHILFNNNEFLKWAIKHTKPNLNMIDDDNNTILTKNIEANNIPVIDFLLKQSPDLTVPTVSPPLIIATLQNKYPIVQKLIKHNTDVNIRNYQHVSPLIIAVGDGYYDIAKYLIDNGADVNYSGTLGEYSPMDAAIRNNNVAMCELLIEHGYDVHRPNKNRELPVHVAVKYDNTLPSIVSLLLYHSDVNVKNIYGYTPVHILIRKNTWMNYTEILKAKSIDVFSKTNDNKNVLTMLSDGNLNIFLNDVVVPKFMTTECKHLQKHKCIKLVKDYLFNSKQPPTESDIVLITAHRTNMGNFSSNILHNLVYTVHMMKKYPNVSIPSQYYIKDKYINDKIHLTNNNLLKYTKVLTGLLETYLENHYEFTPYVIFWKNKNEYYIHNDVWFYMSNCMQNPHIRFIFLKISFATSEQTTHANILIYDKHTHTMERFEPYGNVPNLDNNMLDDILRAYFGGYIKKLTYVTPHDMYGEALGFQTQSKDDDMYVKKHGDPFGYCLAWCFWYLEQRITNPDVKSSALIKQCMDDILQTGGDSDRNVFITFIRNYSSTLTDAKNKMFKSAGIAKSAYYDVVLGKSDDDKIRKYLSRSINK